jgi:hypothetical protein
MNLIPVTPQDLRTTASPTFGNLYDSGLTAGRVTYAGASGLLQDSAKLTFDGTNLTCLGNISAKTASFSRTETVTSSAGTLTSTPLFTLGAAVTDIYALQFNLGLTNAGYNPTNVSGIKSIINLHETSGSSSITELCGWKANISITQSGRGSSLTVANADGLYVPAIAVSVATVTELCGLRVSTQTGGSTRWGVKIEGNDSAFCNIYPIADDTYYLGKNDDDSALAWKGIILKDQTDGKYYRLELNSGSLSVVDLTD